MGRGTGVIRSDRHRPETAVVLFVAVIAVVVGWMVVAMGRPSELDRFAGPGLVFVVQLTVPFAVVGFVVARRVPGNRIGWLFLVGPLFAAAGFLLVELAFRTPPTTAAWLFYLGDAGFFTGIGLMATQFFLRFPTGRAASPRWGAVAVAGLVGVVLNNLWLMTRECVIGVADSAAGLPTPSCADPLQDWFQRFGNPMGLDAALSRAFGIVGGIGALLVLAALFIGLASLGFRYRKADPGERAQLRWLLAVVAVLGPAFFALVVWELVTGAESAWFGEVLVGGALVAIPVAIGMAITRHRLYDIDRLISRTVAYSAVAIILAGLYGLVAVVPVAIIGRGGWDAPSWLVAASTLVAATAFSPLRRRVQGMVDRRFDRSRYDAQRVVDGFGARVRDLARVEEIVTGVGSVVAEALRPGSFGVWIREERS